MKSTPRTALLCLISASLPLAIACGSNDTTGLFPAAGGSSATSVGGSLGTSGSVGHAGQSAGGSSASSAGASGGSSVAGQGTSTGGAGGSGVAGSSTGGMSVGGGGGTEQGGASGGTGGDSAGTGGTSTAGAGGASAGAGGMSTGGGAGGSVGGIGGIGGSSSGGAGGSGGAGCPPEQAPTEGVPCMVETPDNCFYPGKACSCLSNGQTTGKHWGCYLGTPEKCPTMDPTDGASCAGYSGARCPYSTDDFCVCPPNLGGGGGDPKWSCSPKNPNCPDAKPPAVPCGDVRECGYGDRACFCGGATWSCE